jgi:hypothetical protein
MKTSKHFFNMGKLLFGQQSISTYKWNYAPEVAVENRIPAIFA